MLYVAVPLPTHLFYFTSGSSLSQGYSRKGAALLGMDDAMSALEAFEAGLKLDPQNEALLEGKTSAENRLRSTMFGQQDGLAQLGRVFAQPDALAKVR